MNVVQAKAVAAPAKKNTPFFNKESSQDFFHSSRYEQPFFSKKQNRSTGIQAKLTVNQPDDIYEKEADAMADKVVQRLSEPAAVQPKSSSPIGAVTPFIQKKCAHCEEEEKLQKKEEDTVKEQIQRKPIFESNAEPADDGERIQRKCSACEKEEKVHRKSDSPSPQDTSSHIESKLHSSKGSGAPLPTSTRSQMENSFGGDFSAVRIHDDSTAVQMSKDLNAQAFTHGSDIYFNSGKYDASGRSGQYLLSHELTHVIQQNTANSIQRQASAQGQSIKEHGDVTQIPGLLCPTATTSPVDEQRTRFNRDSQALSDLTLGQIQEFVLDWHSGSENATVRLDGYASIEGTEDHNWSLSCQRAISIRDEMVHPTNGAPGIPDSFITIFAHGETNRFSQTDLQPNRTVTITSVIPVRPPIPQPLQEESKKEFIVTAKSYIAPVGSRTGYIMCSSPGFPSLMDPFSVTANAELRLLALATDAAYSENPTTDTKDGGYRLFSSRKLSVYFNSTSITRVVESPLDTDTGLECIPGMGACLHPPALTITKDFHVQPTPTIYNFGWAGKGRPNLLAEPTFQIVCPRLSVFIWHDLNGSIQLVGGVPKITTLVLSDSTFPSDRVFVNGVLQFTHPQGLFKQLWVSDPTDVTRVI